MKNVIKSALIMCTSILGTSLLYVLPKYHWIGYIFIFVASFLMAVLIHNIENKKG